MNTSTKAMIGLGLIAVMVFYQIKSQLPTNVMLNDEINTMIVQVNEAFDKAEVEVLGVKPNPKEQEPESNVQYVEPKARIYVYPKRRGFLERLFFN